MRVVWYMVSAIVECEPPAILEAGIGDLLEELEARTYLRFPAVGWEPEMNRALITVQDEGDEDPQAVAGGVYDDILDSATAVLADFEWIRAGDIDVQPLAEA
ncbi:MAG: hypothetical protein ACRDFX_11225 [Chloroflexota bacterium]